MHKLTPLLFLLILSSCCVQEVTDLTYRGDTEALVESLPTLGDYQNKSNAKYPVVVFIHGGYWEAEDKKIIDFQVVTLHRKTSSPLFPVIR
jgi:acetyl esterase/lipase